MIILKTLLITVFDTTTLE